MPGVGPESIPRKREAGSPTPIPASCAGIDARLQLLLADRRRLATQTQTADQGSVARHALPFR